jgi:hypothetical protein
VNVFKAIHCHPGSRRNAARAPAHAWTLEARRQAQRVARLPLPGTRFKLAGTRSYNGCQLFVVRKGGVKYRNEACYFVLALSSTGVQVPTASTPTSDRSRVFNPRGSAKPLNPTRSSCALLRKDRLLFYQTSRQGEIDDREGFPISSS